MKKLIIIAAVGKNLELGYQNDLIWHIKEDMQFFKKQTIGHHILMGRKTFDSLPRLLPGRKHIVLSTKLAQLNMVLTNDIIILDSKEAFDKLKETIDDDIYVIGGAKIYSEFINEANEVILTEIEDTFNDADVYFPKFNYEDYDKIVLSEHRKSNPSYKHVKYIKKNDKN